MVRNALAMMRLLNKETRTDPGAPERRAAQRAHGQTIWELRDGFIADDLRDVLPAIEPPRVPPPELEGYDLPIPMEEADDARGTEVEARICVLRVG